MKFDNQFCTKKKTMKTKTKTKECEVKMLTREKTHTQENTLKTTQ